MAALPRRGHRPRSIRASAARFDKPKQTEALKRIGLAWQERALEYYECIGELRYAAHFYARMLSRIRIYPGLLGSDGKTTPIEDGRPVELLDRIQDPGGGRSQIQSDYGRLMFVTGEGLLFGANIDQEDERWRFLWLHEIKIENGVTIRLDSNQKEIERGISYRFWRPSPRHSDLADSPVRAVSDVCEELIILTQAVMATASTRMTNGILLLPQEVSYGSADIGVDDDPENNPFIEDFIDHARGQIENPSAAEAKMPFLIEAPYEYMDKIKWFQTHDPQTDYLEKDLRDEAIKRLALGLDFPPEVLLGLTDANHWTAKQVVSDMWRSHGAPIAEQFCDDISEAYLRPALRDEGYSDWQHVVCSFDDADVVVAPDRSEDADRAYDRGAISYEGYRKLKGIPEAMAQSEEEHDEFLAWKLRNPLLLEGEGALATPLRGPLPAPGDQANPEEGPPSPGTRDVARPEARTASAKIMGAAELALIRCREVAGARIRSYKDACPECFAPIAPRPNSLVAALLGAEQVMNIKAPPPLKLVSGGTDAFNALLKDWGFGSTQAAALAEMIEVYAARTLFDEHPAPFPSGFSAHVDHVLEVTDAIEGG